MIGNNFTATSEITINKNVKDVWHALTDARLAREYMFGASVTTDWKEGSSIIWEGEWEGKKFKDKGTILKTVPNSLLQYSHYSPLSGASDVPENYHTVTIKLNAETDDTRVVLTQDGNATKEAVIHSQKNWDLVLVKLKQLVEASYRV
jgi:uncharacterized protein YndB with AHSA1/START domain